MQSGWSVGGLRTAYAAGATDPVAVARDVLARVAARGDDGVWISRVDGEALLARATELARAPRRPPLWGIPFAVKDNIDTAGLPTTVACPDFARTPDRSAPVVRRLLAAGAMLVGKTNLDQFATGLTGCRSPYGTPRSVFGGDLIAGGSSSGSAVAVAAGLVAFALGTDTAGSGRVPAAMNGIAGVKPTRGLLPTVGVVPACRSLDCVSVFAADVAEAAEVAGLAAGPVAGDPWGRAPAPGAWSTAGGGWAGAGVSAGGDAGAGAGAGADAGGVPAAVRLGVPAGALDFEDSGLARAFGAAVERAGAVVAECVPVDLGPFLEAGSLLYGGPWVAERLADLGDFVRDRPDSVLPVIRDVLAPGWSYDAVATFRARHRLAALRAEVDQVWRRVDALLLPTVPARYTVAEIAADPIGRNTVLGRWTTFANLLDLAAVTVPSGRTPDGRPASVSLLGPACSDPLLAGLGAVLAVSAGAPAERAGTHPA
jgi:allophanate hydrolase